MHTEVDFAVQTKAAVGKGAGRKLRAIGRVPGIVYGPTAEPVMVSFTEKDLVKALSTPAERNVFLRLQSDDERVNGARVIVKELQVAPLKRVFVHADFYRLDPNRAIQALVPVHVEGTAVGVKMGGILQIARREILVSCLPDALPEAIVVEVTNLNIGKSIHVSDLAAIEGVTILTGAKLAVCAVIAPSDLKGEEGTEEAAAE